MRSWWRPWRATIVAIAAVIAIGSLASAGPSLRQPRGPYPSATGATGVSRATGATGETGATGHSGAAVGPVEESGGEGVPDFTPCKGLTGLDDAICRHAALLVVHPDDEGLQIALDRLLSNEERRGAAGEKERGHAPGGSSDEGSNPSNGQPAQAHRHSGKAHGNPGGIGRGDANGR